MIRVFVPFDLKSFFLTNFPKFAGMCVAVQLYHWNRVDEDHVSSINHHQKEDATQKEHKIWYRISMQFYWMRMMVSVGFTTCNLYRGQMNHYIQFTKQLFATHYSCTTIRHTKVKWKTWQKRSRTCRCYFHRSNDAFTKKRSETSTVECRTALEIPLSTKGVYRANDETKATVKKDAFDYVCYWLSYLQVLLF